MLQFLSYLQITQNTYKTVKDKDLKEKVNLNNKNV